MLNYNNFYIFLKRTYSIYLKGIVRRGGRDRDLSPTGSLLKWPQWSGLGHTAARARSFFQGCPVEFMEAQTPGPISATFPGASTGS